MLEKGKHGQGVTPSYLKNASAVNRGVRATYLAREAYTDMVRYDGTNHGLPWLDGA